VPDPRQGKRRRRPRPATPPATPAAATPPAALAAAAAPLASGPPPPRIRRRSRRRLLLSGRGRGEAAAVRVLQADAAAPRRHLAAGSRQDPQGELLLLLRFSFCLFLSSCCWWGCVFI